MLYSRNVLMFGIYLMSAFVIKYSTDVHRFTYDSSTKLYITYKFINYNKKTITGHSWKIFKTD